MSQSMPEVLDYRNLVSKLAHIDSEWESLKGMLTFKVPYKSDEPRKASLLMRHSRWRWLTRCWNFPGPLPPSKSRRGMKGSIALGSYSRGIGGHNYKEWGKWP